jgi:hemoglobin
MRMSTHVRDSGLRDIETRADCERVVREFYARVMEDPMIGFIFTDVAKLDLDAHLPRIASFWETILLGAHTYGGGAFRPHLDLHTRIGLRDGHFARWLNLWNVTVDELFAGARAEQAKAHARRVALAFMRRLESFPSPLAQSAAVLTVTRHVPRSSA